MPFITNRRKSEIVDIHYKDYGQGKPVILIHGWPLSHRAWEQQVWRIVKEGFRCISYDRRGFGISSAPWDGYDYSSLAEDLHEIIEQLELREVTLVGFSMGGGEVVRYISNFGTNRLSKIALVSSIIPLVAQKEDNPEGVPQEDIENIIDALQKDRVGFLKGFHKNFYNSEHTSISEEQLHYDWTIAAYASPRATIQCALSWAETDFRPELNKIDIPTLIVHGDSDNIVPIETSGKQAAEMISDNRFEIIEDGPHGLHLTHKEEFNDILISFLKS